MNDVDERLVNDPSGISTSLDIPENIDTADIGDLIKHMQYLRFYYQGRLIHDIDGYYFSYGDMSHIWPKGTPLSQVHADLETCGWKRTEADFLNYVHLAARTALYKVLCKCAQRIPGFQTGMGPFPPYNNEEKNEVFTPGTEPVYIRFGKVPTCGYSTNHLFDEPEAGISCFEAKMLPNVGVEFIHLTEQLRSELDFYLSQATQPIYRLYGRPIGYGWSGEPVLQVDKAELIREAGTYEPVLENQVLRLDNLT